MPEPRPLDWPKIDVESDATPDALAQMIARIEGEFSLLGETEPYWSVLSTDKYKTVNIDSTRDEFYRSGHTTIERVVSCLKRHSIPTTGTVFELGCGVGRLTIPLAGRWDTVIGADISAAHLRIASEAASAVDVHNITWLHANHLAAIDSIPEIDFFFSVIVLQHNPPPIIFMLLRRILSKLRPGGSAYFQVPTYMAGYKFRVDDYLREPPRQVEMHCLTQPDVFRAIEIAGCTVLECREDSAAGENKQTLSNTFMVRRRG